MKTFFSYYTPIGKITIAEKDGQITNLYFEKDRPFEEDNTGKETILLKKASEQLNEYLQGKRKTFCLPLFLDGTQFMVKVWKALNTIPYAETRSYKEIAELIDSPKACRAVGQANNRNPIPIFIPCHRVIGSDGKMTGYRGGLGIKEHLLELEKKYGENQALKTMEK